MDRFEHKFVLGFVTAGVALLFSVQNVASAQKAGRTGGQSCQKVAGSEMVVGPASQRLRDAMLDVHLGQGLDWPDTEIGVVTPISGSGYLFFASNGSCHSHCDSTLMNVPKYGSLARIGGTLDRPLGTPRTPSAPHEFVLKNISGVPPNYNGSKKVTYIGGGPVYRVPAGEPGAGNLLLVYQGAYDTDDQPQGGWYSFLGIAKSLDDGLTWTDLGVVIRSTAPPEHTLSVDIGDGDLVDSGTADPTGRYFYIYFPDLCTYSAGGICGGRTYPFGIDKGMAVARADYEEFLSAAFSDAPSPPALPEFRKFYDKSVTPWLAPTGNFEALHDSRYWQEPGIGGNSTDVWNPSSPYAGDMNVKWNSFLNNFVAIFHNGTNIGYAFSPDGLDWTPVVTLITSSGNPAPNLGSSTLIGVDEDPNVLGSKFYGFYLVYPTNGTGWDKATLNRVTVECSAGAPSN